MEYRIFFKNAKKRYFLVDEEDFCVMRAKEWYLKCSNAVTYINEKRVKAQTIIMERMGFSSPIVYHMNNNKLDNRRHNLFYRKKRKAAPLGTTGIHWCNTREQWIARIYSHGNVRYIGAFKTFEEALLIKKSIEK